jgi:hypothetical protein
MKTGIEELQEAHNKISRDKIEFRILQLLFRFQIKTDDGGNFQYLETRIHWDKNAILAHIQVGDSPGSLSIESVSCALLNLIKMKPALVYPDRGQWFITTDGCQYYVDITSYRNTIVVNKDLLFKNEALTGMTSGGNKSKLTWAALPFSSVNHNPNNSVESAMVRECAAVEEVRAVAKYYDTTPDVAAEWMRTEEVHRCNRCRKQRRHHRHGGANGKRWQSVCIECQRANRSA